MWRPGTPNTVSAQRSGRNGEMSTSHAKIPPIVTLSPQEVLRRLEPEYGPLTWYQRKKPVPELVVTMLSQHTSDLNAERAFQQLMETFGTLEAVARAGEEAIADSIRGGGLADTKAPHIKAALNQILESRGALDLDFLRDLPLNEAKAWLTALPGVGPKTAAVVLLFAFHMPAMPVDTHVHRVARRLGFIGETTSANDAHDLLESMVSPDEVYPLHVYLISHGRRVCKAQRPLCESCALLDGCPTGRARLGIASASTE